MTKETMELMEKKIVEGLNDISQFEESSEERKALSTETFSLIDKLVNAEKVQAEYWDKEERHRVEEEHNKVVEEIDRDRLEREFANRDETNDLERQRMELEYQDKEDRRLIERERNQTTIDVEREKAQMPKHRIVLEILKIAVPTIVPMIAYGIYQKRILEFEETGRINSTAGREHHLPRFW